MNWDLSMRIVYVEVCAAIGMPAWHTGMRKGYGEGWSGCLSISMFFCPNRLSCCAMLLLPQILILASAINLALESPRLEDDNPLLVSLSKVGASTCVSSC